MSSKKQQRKETIARALAELFGINDGEAIRSEGYAPLADRILDDDRFDPAVSRVQLRCRDLPEIADEGLVEAYISEAVRQTEPEPEPEPEPNDDDGPVTTDRYCMGQVCGDESCAREVEDCREHLRTGDDRPGSWGEVEADDITMVPPHPHAGSDRAFIHWPSSQYWFVFGGDVDPFDVPFEHVAKIVEWYTHHGAGLTQATVTRKVITELEREMSHDILQRMLKALNVDKKSTPLPPHITQGAAADDEKAAQKARVWQARDEAAIEQKYREKENKHLRREYKKARQQLMKRREFVEQFIETAEVAPVEAAPEPVDVPVGDGPTSHAPVFVVSDWHIGKSYESDVDEYNLDIARDRVRIYARRIVAELKRSNLPVEDIYLAVVGDIIDGPLANMFDQQHLGQDTHGLDQCVAAAELLAWLVNYVVGSLPEAVNVHVECVAGNHGRSSSDRRGDPFRLPEMLTYKLAEARSPDASWTLHKGAAGHFEVMGTKVILTHGDRTPREIRDLGYAHMGQQVLVISGHSHTGQIDGAADGNVIHVRGGALSGADEFEQDQLGKRFRPVQVMCDITVKGPVPGRWFILDYTE